MFFFFFFSPLLSFALALIYRRVIMRVFIYITTVHAYVILHCMFLFSFCIGELFPNCRSVSVVMMCTFFFSFLVYPVESCGTVFLRSTRFQVDFPFWSRIKILVGEGRLGRFKRCVHRCHCFVFWSLQTNGTSSQVYCFCEVSLLHFTKIHFFKRDS